MNMRFSTFFNHLLFGGFVLLFLPVLATAQGPASDPTVDVTISSANVLQIGSNYFLESVFNRTTSRAERNQEFKMQVNPTISLLGLQSQIANLQFPVSQSTRVRISKVVTFPTYLPPLSASLGATFFPGFTFGDISHGCDLIETIPMGSYDDQVLDCWAEINLFPSQNEASFPPLGNVALHYRLTYYNGIFFPPETYYEHTIRLRLSSAADYGLQFID